METGIRIKCWRTPSEKDSAKAARPHSAHQELEQLVTQMVEVDGNKRPASVALVRQALENIAALKASQPTSQYLAVGLATGGYHLLQGQGQKRGTTQAQPMAVPQPLSNTRFIGSKHTSRVTSVAWSVRGTRIASASYDKTVRVWDVADGSNLVTYQGHWDRVLIVAWSPDGKQLVSASVDHTIHAWHL